MKILEHSDTQNCAANTDHMLSLIGDSNPPTFSEFVPPTTRTILDIPIHDYYMDLSEENAFRYVCGYLIKNKPKYIHVKRVQIILIKIRLFQIILIYIVPSWLNSTEENPLGNLHIASNNFCAYVHKLEEIFVKTYGNNCFQKISVFIPTCADYKLFKRHVNIFLETI